MDKQTTRGNTTHFEGKSTFTTSDANKSLTKRNQASHREQKTHSQVRFEQPEKSQALRLFENPTFSESNGGTSSIIKIEKKKASAANNPYNRRKSVMPKRSMYKHKFDPEEELEEDEEDGSQGRIDSRASGG